MKTTGRIKEINSALAWFTMEDGTRFSCVKGLSLTGYKPGHEVTVSYEMKAGKKIASRLSKATKAKAA